MIDGQQCVKIVVESGVSFCGQPAGEADNGDAFLFCTAGDAEGPFTLEGLLVDAPFPCNDALSAGKRFVKSRYIQKIIDAMDQSGAEKAMEACGRAACCPS